jgi:hypothetical protein
MAQTFGFYLNSSLTTPITKLSQAFAEDGSDGAVDRLVYIGSTVSGKKLLAATDPGVDPIPIFVDDEDGEEEGQSVDGVKLALSQADLDTAVAGAPIDGPSQILSGAINALPVWIRREPTELEEGTYNDLKLRFGPARERLA